jgi:ribosome production factor 2
MALKRPHAIAFNKKNPVHPFDATSTSISSLEFWANKNDASMFVVGQTTKKRPHGLTFVRMYDGRVLDMTEVGVESWVGMADFKVFLFLVHPYLLSVSVLIPLFSFFERPPSQHQVTSH